MKFQEMYVSLSLKNLLTNIGFVMVTYLCSRKNKKESMYAY